VSNYVYLRGTGSPSLGAVSVRGITIDYYASPTSLKWTDRGMKSLHDKMVQVDIAFREYTKMIVGAIRPLVGLARLAGIKVTDKDLDDMLSAPGPSAALGLILEVAFGGRKIDDAFMGVLRILSGFLIYNAGACAIIAAVCGAIGAAGVVAAGTGALLISAAAAFGVASVACGIAGSVLKSLSNGEMPSRADFGAMMKSSAQVAGEPVPTEAQIDAAYAATNVAFVAAGGKPAPGRKTDRAALDQAKEKKARLLEEEQARQRAAVAAAAIVASRRIEPARPEQVSLQTKDEPSPSGFPVVPAALAAGVALFLFMRR
jgi:hypothetical protein